MKKRDFEILINTTKKLYKDVLKDLKDAMKEYEKGDPQLAELLMNSAIVKSNILIADRLDIIYNILIRED